MKGKVVFLIAPPAAGKGTQARVLTAQGFHHVEMSKVLAGRSPLTARELNGPNLVNSTIVIEALKDYLEPFPEEQDLVLDGFPRTEAQARFAVSYFGQIHVAFVIIEADDLVCINRVKERYDVDLMNHQENGGVPPRASDFPEVHEERLKVYRREMVELEDFLMHHVPERVHRVNGHLSADNIAEWIRKDVIGPHIGLAN